jgi:biotin carboxyl carrier protein
MDVLAQNRVIKGIFAPSFDGNKVERQLLSLEGVSFASVEKRGTRVYVRVVSELAPNAYVDVGEGGVTASFDGIVTRIIVFSGTAEVQVGDVVTKGQTLIGDYYLKGEDKIPVNPAGEVYGQRVVTVERFFPSQHMAYSGRTKTISRMGVFGHTKPPTPPYDDYEVKVEKVNNTFLLPYSVTRWTYYEISLVDNNLSPEDMMAVAYGEAVAEGNFEQVISHSSTIDEVAGGHLVKTVLTVEEKL